jgi:hypothetical protein
MPFSEKHRYQFTLIFTGLFYLLALYKWANGMWMVQAAPHFFTIPFDGTAWLLMQTGIHQLLLDNPAGWLVADLLFYGFPLFYLACYLKWTRLLLPAAVLWLVVNTVYVICYTLYPTNSAESHTAWILFPLLFATIHLRSFYLLMHGLRYFFLFFFASAGLWKLYQGGAFHLHQMSGVLLQQHAHQLAASPLHWYSRFIYFIIHHPVLGYCLYLAGTLLELCFAIGIFTRQFDRWLIVAFVLFLVMDLLLMKIPYFETLPLLLPLLFSRLQEPRESVSKWAEMKCV